VIFDHHCRAALDCPDEGVRAYVTCVLESRAGRARRDLLPVWDNKKSRTESL